MQIDLSDRVALVTGASRGIGRAIALGLGEAGATVAVHFGERHLEAESVAASLTGARAFRADLASVEEAAQLFEDVIAAYGRVDVLVNNAGIAIPVVLEDAEDAWLAAWQRTLDVNLRAPELLMRLALRHHLQRDEARSKLRIINIASRAAFRGDTPEYTAYAASKGGLVALTRTIARGYGKRGVRAFTVAPGFTMTEMAEDFVARYGEHVIGDVSLERITEAEDVAPIVAFLASGSADHATGSTIDVNAGSYVH